ASSVHVRVHQKSNLAQCRIPLGARCDNWGHGPLCVPRNNEDGGPAGIQDTGSVGVWGQCSDTNGCQDGLTCVKHAPGYTQCKPAELPQGELVWPEEGRYGLVLRTLSIRPEVSAARGRFPLPEPCIVIDDSVLARTRATLRIARSHHGCDATFGRLARTCADCHSPNGFKRCLLRNNNGGGQGSCTITNYSQCDDQNWSGSPCCADPSFECRWADNGSNVKLRSHSWICLPLKTSTPSHPHSIISMKLALLLVSAGVVATVQASNVHVRVHHKNYDSSCTITNWSQCDGQNWSGSTCCADPSFECRWDDKGQNVKLCQPRNGYGPGPTPAPPTTPCPGPAPTTKAPCKGSVGVWGQCSDTNGCQDGLTCVKHSPNYSQCKPAELPQGELCGQKKGDMDWFYDKCPSGQKCLKQGDDFRCQNAGYKHHHKRHHHHSDEKNGQCTITNWSQCDGQNWTGSTCCADPGFECRWSDNGNNVKTCQPRKWHHHKRHHHHSDEKNGQCTITNWSQCDGQNWSGSTCCADPGFECRWADNGNNVKFLASGTKPTTISALLSPLDSPHTYFDRCDWPKSCMSVQAHSLPNLPRSVTSTTMKVALLIAAAAVATTHASTFHVRVHHKGADCTITNWSQCDGQNWSGSTCSELPKGELCGQKKGDMDWFYDKCPSGQKATTSVARTPASTTSIITTSSTKSCIKGTLVFLFLAAATIVTAQNAAVHPAGNVAVWGQCSDANGCQDGLTCVKHSPYYSQCKPVELPQGDLCGQKKHDMDWFYDHCPSHQKCLKQGEDFRCQNAGEQQQQQPQSTTKVAVWGQCSDTNGCQDGLTCVKHSPYYSQCKPAELPQGDLCGQKKHDMDWFYDHCPSHQKCLKQGEDFRCQNAGERRLRQRGKEH
ncbi:TPA: LOW QUALITY PROTEIN: hypothetical protein N0F65_006214, partial [Lagenidium giganteum]